LLFRDGLLSGALDAFQPHRLHDNLFAITHKIDLLTLTWKQSRTTPFPEESIHTALILAPGSPVASYKSALFTGLATLVSCFTFVFFLFGGAGLDDLLLLFLETEDPVMPMRCRRFRSVTIMRSFSAFLWDKIP